MVFRRGRLRNPLEEAGRPAEGTPRRACRRVGSRRLDIRFFAREGHPAGQKPPHPRCERQARSLRPAQLHPV